MKSRKLKNMPYADAKVYEYRKADGDSGNYDILVSYTTPVLEINYDSCLVTCGGLYSRTTIKHISSFMREKNMNYYIAKRCYNDNMKYNFMTGEYIKIGEN
jgi:hypothetical protein